MKKVLNPTTVLTLTVLSRSAGTPRVLSCGGHPCTANTPGGDKGLCHHIPHRRLDSRMAQAGGSLKGSTDAPCTQPAPSSHGAPCKAQSFTGDVQWLLVREQLQGWERRTQGWERGKTPLLQMGGLESCKEGTSLSKDSAQGSGRSQPLPDLPKVQQD